MLNRTAVAKLPILRPKRRRVSWPITHHCLEDTSMSPVPRNARLFRFLAVAASATSIALMLGTGSNADQLKCMSLSTESCSRLPQHQFKPHRRLAQDDLDDCQKC